MKYTYLGRGPDVSYPEVKNRLCNIISLISKVLPFLTKSELWALSLKYALGDLGLLMKRPLQTLFPLCDSNAISSLLKCCTSCN